MYAAKQAHDEVVPLGSFHIPKQKPSRPKKNVLGDLSAGAAALSYTHIIIITIMACIHEP